MQDIANKYAMTDIEDAISKIATILDVTEDEALDLIENPTTAQYQFLNKLSSYLSEEDYEKYKHLLTVH